MSDERSPLLGDVWDEERRKLIHRPDTISTQSKTITVSNRQGTITQDWIVETFRTSDRDDEDRIVKSNDTACIRWMDNSGAHRIILPPEVLSTLVRQREALTTKNQRTAGRNAAQKRKAARGGGE